MTKHRKIAPDMWKMTKEWKWNYRLPVQNLMLNVNCYYGLHVGSFECLH